ncbi:multiple coagulation factor deficiency protein 2 homolog [Lineus longissimus]|uniref:multiple coagulation factor deficiency protein 2 homolog n=1 Tax=Lineus longissimus TaxID=88925 RepID=UPI002B4E933B
MAQFIYLVLIPMALYGQLCTSHENQGDQEYDINNESKEAAEEHLKEHLKDITGDKLDLKTMSTRERAIYTFRVHDLNKDNQMDGLEVFKIYSEHNYGRREKQTTDEYEEDMIARVDRWLERFDFDKDGYVSLAERLRLENQ